jgi:hypothetical protein
VGQAFLPAIKSTRTAGKNACPTLRAFAAALIEQATVGELWDRIANPPLQTPQLLVDLLAEAKIGPEGNADPNLIGSFRGGFFGRHDAPRCSSPAETIIGRFQPKLREMLVPASLV